MATYTTIKNGSKGNDVKTLQELLNQNGANLTVDGIFGNNTLNAVRNYQQSNNLAVDGIVGTNTWGALTGNSPTSSGSSFNSSSLYNSLGQYEAPAPTFSQSANTTRYQDILAGLEANPVAPYESRYEDQIAQLLGDIQNRPDFQYDFNADPLYQQYKGQYTNMGQLAMADTMGNAAALTGGYGNTYAQTAGQQAYQGYLQQLNNVIPELAQQSYGRYRDEGTDMYNQMNLVRGLEDSDYGKYRDTVSDRYNDLGYYSGRADTSWGQDYDLYNTSLNSFYNDRDYNYNKFIDALNQENWEKEFALANQKKSSGGGGSSSNTVNSDVYNSIVQRAMQTAQIGNQTGNDGSANAVALLQNNVENGYISEREAKEIYEKYIK